MRSVIASMHLYSRSYKSIYVVEAISLHAFADLCLLMEGHASLLLDLISRQTNAVIKGLLMRHTLATSFHKKKKADLAKMLLTHVLEDPEARYRTVVADFTKKRLLMKYCLSEQQERLTPSR